MFLTNLTAPNKLLFIRKLLVGLRVQSLNSNTMYKINLLYNEEELFFTKIEWLSLKITLALAKLDMVGSRLVSNGWIFSYDIPVDIQLVTYLLLSNISELSISAKTKTCDNIVTCKYILPNKTLFLIFVQLYLLDQYISLLVFFSVF